MKNCHCHSNSVGKKDYSSVKHIVHFNTVDNKPLLGRSNLITAWRKSNRTNLELGLASNQALCRCILAPPGSGNRSVQAALSAEGQGQYPAVPETLGAAATSSRAVCGTVLASTLHKAFLLRSLPQGRQAGFRTPTHRGGEQSFSLFPFPVGARHSTNAVIPTHRRHGLEYAGEQRAGRYTGAVLCAASINSHSIWSHLLTGIICTDNPEDCLAFLSIHSPEE